MFRALFECEIHWSLPIFYRKLRLYLNIQLKEIKENFSQTRKYKNQKNKKSIPLGTWFFVFKEKLNSCPYHSHGITLLNFLLHIVGMLKIYIFIAYYHYNIVHENKRRSCYSSFICRLFLLTSPYFSETGSGTT